MQEFLTKFQTEVPMALRLGSSSKNMLMPLMGRFLKKVLEKAHNETVQYIDPANTHNQRHLKKVDLGFVVQGT